MDGRNPRKLLAGASLVLSMLAASPARAGDVDDVVRLKDGGILRGVIIELAADDHVLIRLPTGEDRRVEMSEVEFAGPRSEDPHAEASAAAERGGGEAEGAQSPEERGDATTSEAPQAAPAPAAAPPDEPGPGPGATEQRASKDQITLVSNQVGVTFHELEAASSKGTGPAAHSKDAFSRLCTAPCKAHLAPGPHQLALSIRDRDPIVAGELTTTGAPMTIEGKYDDYATVRVAGWSLIVGGGVVALSSFLFAHNDCPESDGPDCKSFDLGVLFGMSGAGIAAAVGGFFMVRIDDDATVRVSPGIASMGTRRLEVGRAAF